MERNRATMSLKVLVTDVIAQCGLDYLREKALEVDVHLGLSTEELIKIVPRYDALIVRSRTKVTRDVIDAGKNLKIIGRAGLSTENIDIAAASERGIIVCNVPDSNITSVAEMTMCLMLMCARNAAQASASMSRGQWNREQYTGIELYGKTLLIVGLGRFGGLVAQYARAFGMNVLAYDPYCSSDRAAQLGAKLCATLAEALPKADVISLHLPKTVETTGMIGAEEFAAMKTGVILLNVSYAGTCNMKALADFVAAGKIASVGIDVYDEEPCTDSPLLEFPQVVLTPHLGPETHDAHNSCSSQIAEHIYAGLSGLLVPTAVNLSQVPAEVVDSVGPYIVACETAGAILGHLDAAIPRSLTVTTAGKLANCDATALAAASLKGLLSSREVEHITTANYEVMARCHGISVSCCNGLSRQGYSAQVDIAAGDQCVSIVVPDGVSSMRLVSFLGYDIDIVPTRNSVIFEYVDAPGRIGLIGTILGAAGVNITTMQIGTKPAQKTALVYLNVDDKVSEEVMCDIAQHIDLINSWQISL